MASMKAKKGNPFEREVAYNLMEYGMYVVHINDNTPGIDLIAKENTFNDSFDTYYIECKFHKGFSWNELEKILNKTSNTMYKYLEDRKTDSMGCFPVVIFKANRQPVLVAHYDTESSMVIETAEGYFSMPTDWKKIPKGVKIWNNK